MDVYKEKMEFGPGDPWFEELSDSEASGLVNAAIMVLMHDGVARDAPAEAGAVRRALVGAVAAGAGRALLLGALRGRLKEAVGRMLDAVGTDEPAARLREFVGE